MGMEEEKRYVTAPSESCKDFIKKCFACREEKELFAFYEKMEILQQFLYETNEKFNLTALKTESFWSKHVADSLSLVLALPSLATEKMKVLDLGCGAGFPSLVLAAACPFSEFTSVDSTGKKIAFVNMAVEKLSLKNLKAVHARGNELARKEPYRRAYDAVTARAVAAADILVKEGASFLKNDGKSILAIYRTSTQLEGEKAYLNGNKKIRWEATTLFSLPEDAGTRQFLFISAGK